MKYFLIMLALILLAPLNACQNENEKETKKEKSWFLFKEELGDSEWKNEREMAWDSRGHIYIPISHGWDEHLAKYDRQGNMLWKKLLFENADITSIRAAAADSLDNIYITGYVSGDDTRARDVFLVKLTPQGDQALRKHWGDWVEEGWGTAVDSGGNVYVLAGMETYSDDALILHKFDRLGNLKWMQVIWNRLPFRAKLAVDGADNLYVSAEDHYDILLFKYDVNGNQLWLRKKSASDITSLRDMIVDKKGDIYIAGDTRGYPGGVNWGKRDIFWLKYDAQGNLTASGQWGGAEREECGGAAVDSDNNFYIVGSAVVPENTWLEQIALLKYDPAGNMIAERKLGNNVESHEGRSILVDEEGYVYITADIGETSYLFKLEPMADQP